MDEGPKDTSQWPIKLGGIQKGANLFATHPNLPTEDPTDSPNRPSYFLLEKAFTLSSCRNLVHRQALSSSLSHLSLFYSVKQRRGAPDEHWPGLPPVERGEEASEPPYLSHWKRPSHPRRRGPRFSPATHRPRRSPSVGPANCLRWETGPKIPHRAKISGVS